jgi:hypothetical protein|tara:strand:- start:1255 stop:1395 length:141 start_codon:yes stop_codon:yes gene_type:complete
MAMRAHARTIGEATLIRAGNIIPLWRMLGALRRIERSGDDKRADSS